MSFLLWVEEPNDILNLLYYIKDRIVRKPYAIEDDNNDGKNNSMNEVSRLSYRSVRTSGQLRDKKS